MPPSGGAERRLEGDRRRGELSARAGPVRPSQACGCSPGRRRRSSYDSHGRERRACAGAASVGEQPRTGPAGERVDEQVQPVDQAVGEHRPHQRAAAADVEVAVDLVLQAADRVGVVGPDDLRVAPRRLGQRPGDDVLGGVVEERRPGVVLDRPRRPRGLEHLVGRAPEQDAPAASRDRADRLAHLAGRSRSRTSTSARRSRRRGS